MSVIQVESHDVLGILTIIKNYVSVVLSDTTLSSVNKQYLERAYEANEKLIAEVKEKGIAAKKENINTVQ